MSEHAIDGCPCRCHLGGPYPLCSIDGGCADTHTTTGCGVCGAPTGDDGRLCVTHTDQLRRDLGGIPDLAAELDVTITRQNRGRPQPGGRSAERPLPYNVHTSGVRVDLETTVNAWALDVSRMGEDPRDPLRVHAAHDLPAVAAWLVRNLPTLRKHPEAAQAFDELTHAVSAGWRAVDIARDRIVLGACRGEALDEDGEPTGAECEQVVYGDPASDTATCRGCGSVHVIAERREWMLGAVGEHLATSGQLSTLIAHLGRAVGRSTIRGWAAAGKLEARAWDRNDRAMYRVADVVALAFGGEPGQDVGAA